MAALWAHGVRPQPPGIVRFMSARAPSRPGGGNGPWSCRRLTHAAEGRPRPRRSAHHPAAQGGSERLRLGGLLPPRRGAFSLAGDNAGPRTPAAARRRVVVLRHSAYTRCPPKVKRLSSENRAPSRPGRDKLNGRNRMRLEKKSRRDPPGADARFRRRAPAAEARSIAGSSRAAQSVSGGRKCPAGTIANAAASACRLGDRRAVQDTRAARTRRRGRAAGGTGHERDARAARRPSGLG